MPGDDSIVEHEPHLMHRRHERYIAMRVLHRHRVFVVIEPYQEVGNEWSKMIDGASVDDLADDDVLSAWNRCHPRLRQDCTIHTGLHWPGLHVDVIKVMQQSDRVSFLHRRAALQEGFVVAVEWGDGKAVPIDHLQLFLCSGRMAGNRFDGPVHQIVPEEKII